MVANAVKGILKNKIFATSFIDGIKTNLELLQTVPKEYAQKLMYFAQKDSEFVNSSILGNSINERIKNFSQRFKAKRNRRQTGAREMTAEEYFRNEKIAIEKYDEIRKLTTDVQQIAKNTKMPEYKIAKIKHHVFVDDSHILDLRVGRVDPEIPIAEAWNRLINGNFIPSDIRLLEHEYFESKFEKIFKTILRQAHDAAEHPKVNKVWNP